MRNLNQAPTQSIPDFMQEAALNLQQEISTSQKQVPRSFFSVPVLVALFLLLLIVLALLTFALIIQREKTRRAKFRDQIRFNDLLLIQQALEKFYQIHSRYPPSKESTEFQQVIKTASSNKKPLTYGGKPNLFLKLLQRINQGKWYQRLVGLGLDTQTLADPRQGENLENSTERVFDYYYSSQSLDQKHPRPDSGANYYLWCYPETTPGNKTRGGFNVFELKSKKEPS